MVNILLIISLSLLTFVAVQRRSIWSYPIYLGLVGALAKFGTTSGNSLLLGVTLVFGLIGMLIARGVFYIPFDWRKRHGARKSTRYRYDGAVELQDPSGSLVLAVVEDISETGISIAIETATATGPDRKWQKGSAIEIVVRGPRNKVDYIMTEVMWFRDEEGMRRFGLKAGDPERIQEILDVAKNKAFEAGELKGIELLMDDPAIRWGGLTIWGGATLYLVVQLVAGLVSG
jgi:hypothetical protein